MAGLTFARLEETNLSISQIARVAGVHRQTVAKRLEQAGLIPVVEKAKEKRFEIIPAIRALIEFAQSESSADRRNMAQAKKCEIETEILQKKYIPIPDAIKILSQILGALNRVVQDSKLENEEKEIFIEKIHSSFPEIEV